MIPLWLVCAAMLAANPPAADAAPTPDRAAYQVVKAKVGRDAGRAETWGQKAQSARAGPAPAHVRLGAWGERNGLTAEATAHYTQAVVLNPHLDDGWKHLGFVVHNGRWMSREAIAAEQKEA